MLSLIFRVSPLGVIPKKSAGEYRVIHHLSYPEGNSVHDFIPYEFSSTTIQDAIAVIKKFPSSIYLGKADIESAFHITPVSPLDTPLLGFKWNGFFYMDAVLPMGCSSSCPICEAFSSAVEWVAVSSALEWVAVSSALEWVAVSSALEWVAVSSALEWVAVSSALEWVAVRWHSVVQWSGLHSGLQWSG